MSPRGRDEVMAALVAAAADLLAVRAPSAVSVRDIATAADVNQALLFRHFGTKAGLLKAVLDQLGNAFGDDLLEAFSTAPFGQIDTLVEVAGRHRRYFDIIVRLVLDPEAADIDFEYPIVSRFVDDDARRAETLDLIAAIMGWLAFEPYLAGAIGIPAARPDELAVRLGRLTGLVPDPSTP